MTIYHFFFFKQKTSYEMRIRDWSSDVCSSDLLRVLVEAPGIERAVAAVGETDCVGDHVVVMRERVERAGREVSERRDHPSVPFDPATLDAAGRDLFFEPPERPVVPGLDRVENGVSGWGVAEEGEHTAGLLGRQGEVVADAHRGWSTTLEEPGEVLAGHQPLVLGSSVSD